MNSVFMPMIRPTRTTFQLGNTISTSTPVYSLPRIRWWRTMATVKDSIPHLDRTSGDHRQKGMYSATIGRIEQVNPTIRLLRLYLDNDQTPLRHLPGQYVDLQIPEIERVGGFTITSPPQTAMRLPAPTPSTTTPPTAATFDDPYVELAVQKSPENPPAAYVWQSPEKIMNAPVQFRIGGNFTYPPMSLTMSQFQKIDNVVLIAGGVGINPIISMISAMDLQGAKKMGGLPPRLRVLYSSKRGKDQDGKVEEILFEQRLRGIAAKWAQKGESVDLRHCLFETSRTTMQTENDLPTNMRVFDRRIQHDDLFEALGPEDKRQNTLVYVCGLPGMTDQFVEVLRKAPGMDEKRVLCEKWW